MNPLVKRNVWVTTRKQFGPVVFCLELCLLPGWDEEEGEVKREGEKEQEKFDLERRGEEEEEGKSHLDLAFISGADPVWGEFSAGLAVEQREALSSLTAAFLQTKSHFSPLEV